MKEINYVVPLRSGDPLEIPKNFQILSFNRCSDKIRENKKDMHNLIYYLSGIFIGLCALFVTILNKNYVLMLIFLSADFFLLALIFYAVDFYKKRIELARNKKELSKGMENMGIPVRSHKNNKTK